MSEKFDEILTESKDSLRESIRAGVRTSMAELVEEAKAKRKPVKEEDDEGDDPKDPDDKGNEGDEDDKTPPKDDEDDE